jgi:hypothetical protein
MAGLLSSSAKAAEDRSDPRQTLFLFPLYLSLSSGDPVLGRTSSSLTKEKDKEE